MFATSVAARIRAYYEALPEASLSEPVVRAGLGDGPSRFRGRAMQSHLKFSLGAGGCGLSRADQANLGALLLQLEASQNSNDGGLFTEEFPTEGAFVGGLRQEQHRIVAQLKWLEVPIEVGGIEYFFYHRDLLDVAINAVRSAKKLDLLGGALPPAPDGSARQSSTLNSDLILNEAAAIQALHGHRARPLFASLHADAAVISWSGAAYVYPIRAEFPSVLDGGNRWVTVGYIPHIPKSVSRNAKAVQAVSDARNDLLQRCLAVVLRRFSRASETGIPVNIPNLVTALLVARVGSVVVDYMEERRIYALMGSRSTYVCTQCRVRHGASCAPDTADAEPHDVIQTLEAQLAAAERRLVDPRVSLRGPLGKAHSALAFAPALGSMHGLSTGSMSYSRILSFDLLHVWKLGMLRTLAQRIPGFLNAVCIAREGAFMGPVQQSLDVLNLRGFEIGRRCKVKPVAPGCFVPPKEKRATMTGRSWRHFAAHWPHIIAGLIGPADPERLVALAAPRQPGAGDEDAGCDDYDDLGPEEDDEEAHQPIPAGISIGAGSAYHARFGDMPVEDAVQDMFGQAAKLGGLFMGDNKGDTVNTTASEVTEMADCARKLGRSAQLLLGPVHTSKLHRLMRHLRSELELRGNLWEGDTSHNESRHKICKRMYQRSNKRGPTLALQMMRGEQAQTEVLRGISDSSNDDEDESEDEERVEERNAVTDSHAEDVLAVPLKTLHLSTRRVRVPLESLCGLSGLSDLAHLLELDVSQTVTVAKTLKFYSQFEWGAVPRIQFLRATMSFNKAPWFDHVRYKGDDGTVRWGEARLVLRQVGDLQRHCVVIKRMRVIAARPGCVLTAHGCQRLAWDFLTPESLWPAVEVVDVNRLLRLEHISPDWQDLADRCGMRVMPSKQTISREENHAARFFVNAFYPWTSRRAAGQL